MPDSKIRHQCMLEPRLSERLNALACQPGVTKSDIMAKALEAFLERRGQSDEDARYSERLDRLSRENGRIRRNTELLIESLAVYVRYSFLMNANLPVPDDASHAVALKTFDKYVNQVGSLLAKGKSLLAVNDENQDTPIPPSSSEVHG
ncbi:MAG: CopG family transcriptional regulator [Alphaproteobacteria bacterium]|nr:CopG family transcriptional regulator [Alphaproteobacteria bacterium]